jgi:dTDP-4-dehydrorhamnose reductase
MRILVTGAGGGIGRAFLERASSGHEVVPLTHRDLPVEDAGAVSARVRDERPDLVLHLAAKTSVDACEEDPDAARLVNARGTGNVARAAKEAGSLLVALSTDYVFDGEKGEPYDETDAPNPVNAYGRSKVEAERAVEDAGGAYIIVRTSWVFGSEGEFVRRSVDRLAAGREAGAIVDQVGTPTPVGHLAERLLPVVEAGLRGVVHLAGAEPTTWFDVLIRAKALGNLPGQVIEREADELGRPARRPRNSALTSRILSRTAVPPFPPLDEGIREVVADVR